MIKITGIYPEYVDAYSNGGVEATILTNVSVKFGVLVGNTYLKGETIIHCDDGELPSYGEIKSKINEDLQSVLGELNG
ncbi:hypothetical protein MKX78_10690 [Cytobacillus sp. FSL R5-0569]|uniref:hypothetical protein n=1 Tax=Cytobacillus sp. FSL R5-0569 TaxID=2921649 RepID=UPI0030FABB0F